MINEYIVVVVTGMVLVVLIYKLLAPSSGCGTYLKVAALSVRAHSCRTYIDYVIGRLCRRSTESRGDGLRSGWGTSGYGLRLCLGDCYCACPCRSKQRSACSRE